VPRVTFDTSLRTNVVSSAGMSAENHVAAFRRVPSETRYLLFVCTGRTSIVGKQSAAAN
jgi:hypothetical protein